jgi:predicted GNAT family acetyltransferase
MDADGGTAFVEYIIDGDEITFTSTEVPKEAEGKGVAGKLVAAAVAYAREAKLRVIPQCPYVASWMKRHRENDDILHPEYRAG